MRGARERGSFVDVEAPEVGVVGGREGVDLGVWLLGEGGWLGGMGWKRRGVCWDAKGKGGFVGMKRGKGGG